MVITRKTPEELEDALKALGVEAPIAARLSQDAPDVAEMLLAEAAEDQTLVLELCAKVMKNMSRPSSILRMMRRDWMAEAMAKAMTDEERAELEAYGDDRSLTYAFSVVFKPDEFEDGTKCIGVRVPALPGCNTYGKNIDKARKLVASAAKLCVSVYVDDDKPVPADSTVDTRTGKSTLTPEPGQTVEVIMVTVEVPEAQ